MGSPVSASHRRMVLSHEPDTIRDSSGENATELTWLECPTKIFKNAGQFKGFPLFTGTICEAIFVISHLIDSYLISEFPVWQSKANQNMTRGIVILLAYTLLSEMFATLEVMLYLSCVR